VFETQRVSDEESRVKLGRVETALAKGLCETTT